MPAFERINRLWSPSVTREARPAPPGGLRLALTGVSSLNSRRAPDSAPALSMRARARLSETRLGKLTQAPSRLGSLPPRVSRPVDSEGHSRALEPWRGWYNLREWQDLRARVFARDRFTCCCGCRKLITEPRERIADHKDPDAKLSRERFFADDEVQTLWKPCHDGWKQRLERRAQRGGRGV